MEVMFDDGVRFFEVMSRRDVGKMFDSCKNRVS